MATTEAALSRFFTPHRDMLLQIVQANPGVPINELRTRAGLSWGSFYHHLGRLEQAGLLGLRKDGRFKRVFPVQQVNGAHDYLLVLTTGKGMTRRRVANAILTEPGLGVERVCELVGVERRLANYHLQHLVEGGLVTRDEGSTFYPTDALRRWLIALFA